MAPFGKRIHGALYVAASAAALLEEDYRSALSSALTSAPHALATANVLKFDLPRRVSFLEYGDLFLEPFPALKRSVTVDLNQQRLVTRDFSRSPNPPILHRKELLLPADHPDRARFAALTDALEAEGLLDESRLIGFRVAWEARLASRGFRVEEGMLVRIESRSSESVCRSPDRDSEMPDIQRYRTAIARDRLSAPMQALARYGFLTPDRTVLDYGCGQGDDVSILHEAGVPASGWDPHYAPDTPLEPANVVNLGFVLNVIEEPAERREVLTKAFALAQRCLAIAVLVVGKGDTSGLAPYRDGFMTRRGTFQKYFRQEETKELIESTLDSEAIPVGPGVFFVFKDRLSEQEFLLERQARRLDASLLAMRRRTVRHVSRRRQDLERLRPLLERLWDTALGLGREPAAEDLAPDLAEAVATEIGSARKALKLCTSLFDPAEFDRATADRREDLLVYFALNLFNGRTPYSSMPKGLQRDVKVHFGGLRQAQEAATTLLFDVGKPDVVARAAEEAAASGLGYLDNGQLQLHSELISRLPPILRCFVGCAARLYGDVALSDLVKIHSRSGKLTLLSFDGFDRPVPRLRERVKIDMRSLEIRFFDYRDQVPPQLLYLESRYLGPDQAGGDLQRTFDEALQKTGLFDFTGFGPPGDLFERLLLDAGFAIRGNRLIKRRKPLSLGTEADTAERDPGRGNPGCP